MTEEGWSFKCKTCGATDLYVEHEYTETERVVDTLACICDEDNNFASQKTYCAMTSYVERGTLDNEHRINNMEKPDELEQWEEENNSIVECAQCLDDSNNSDWTTEVEHIDNETENDEFRVFCAGCDREIEFGWSHPDRGGRIWPAECSDFNPWKSWPEPRHRDSWLKQGWIRPDFR